jgi:predicted dehydrogenase
MTHQQVSRRDVLKTTAAASAAIAATSFASNFAYAAASDKIRVGLVGCGGRGTGAAGDCCLSNDNVELVAIGDVFPDRVEEAKKKLGEKLGDKYKVGSDRAFVGFDAYKKVIASDVDLVILATPPGFRPMHIEAAVDAGKHIFAEKPVATDPAGIRKVLAAAEKIKQKKLAFVTGTQRRHDFGYNATIKKIHEGAIGDLVSAQCYWNQGFLWMKPRQPSWSDMEWQLRNWLYFTWLSGDHIVEQHVHNIDVLNWCFQNHPVSAYGMGGRQVRTDPAYGNIFDHFAIEYVYPGGVRAISMCRQIDGTDSRVSERVVGTKGTANPAGSIEDLKGERIFRFRKESGQLGPYQQEHKDLVDSIRKGEPLNECQRVAESTLTAIMGRMSAYTGKEVTWEQAMNSTLELFPKDNLTMDMSITVPPVPVPGRDKLV